MSYYQDSLFSEEEITGQKNLFSDTENDDSQKASEPVTCLGMTFANDDERRSYFRAELRKKLPELRHIEGFPIGSDDDIINLSDPPYYTACPNPWLNDFIAEWEEEKKQLEAEGKRSADFEVTEPYAADVSEGKSNPIYNAHTYHTKVPFLAIMRYIMHYTQPGDTVFDGFSGTGMTGVAANFCGSNSVLTQLRLNTKSAGKRNCICSDLSPIASSLSASFNSKIDVQAFITKARNILNQLKKEYGWMYSVETNTGKGELVYMVWSDVYVCPSCGEEIVFCSQMSDLYNGKINNNFVCPKCHSKQSKKTMNRLFESVYDDAIKDVVYMAKTVPVLLKYRIGTKVFQRELTNSDFETLQKISKLDYPCWIPSIQLKEGYNTNQPIRSNGIKYVHQFYTKRNLILLSRMYDLIGDDSSLRFWFTSQLINLSKLNRYRPEVSFPYNPLNGTLYIGSQVCESNIFDAYENKLSKIANALSAVESRNVSQTCSATNIPIESNSIDYMFVDPPFGANIMYSDLNSIWEGWLKVSTDNKEEAIINPVQGKTLFDYQNLMNKSLAEFYRILKPGKWLTMEFSNTSASVWNSIQNALQGVGFVVTNVAALDKQQGSFKAVTTTTAVKQDLVITCYKPSDELTEKFKTSEDLAMNVWDFVEELLCHLPVHLQKGNKTTAVVERSPKILFDRVISYYVQHGYPVPMNAADFQRGLRERFVERDGMFFTAEQSLEYDTKRAHTESYEAAQSMFVGSEAEGIEWLKRELVEPKTYQDLQPEWMQALVQTKKGDNLPELKQILEENFLKDDEGRWYKPDPEKEADLEKVRARELARNFKAYVELASTPKGKIKEARLEALRYGFRECYKEKDFATIVKVAQRLPEALVMEDDVLLQFYDIAINRV